MNRDTSIANDVPLSDEQRNEILAVYHELDVFEDVRDGINRLRDGGYECNVVSNGNPDMLASMVEHAEIEALIEDTISADEIRMYKPDAEIYRHAHRSDRACIGRLVRCPGRETRRDAGCLG